MYEESCWLEVMLKVIPACKCLYNWGWNPLHPQGKPTWGAVYRQVVRWMCWVLWCCTQDCISYFFWLLDMGNPGCILVFRVSSLKSCCDGSVKKNPGDGEYLLLLRIQSVKGESSTSLTYHHPQVTQSSRTCCRCNFSDMPGQDLTLQFNSLMCLWAIKSY